MPEERTIQKSQLKISCGTELKLVQMIPNLTVSMMKSPRKNGIISDDKMMLSDIYSYFIYLCNRCTSTKEAIDIYERFERYKKELRKTSDINVWFFSILQTQLLLMFELGIYSDFPGSKTRCEDFEKRFSKEIEEYISKG
jgi:hypothetical protein